MAAILRNSFMVVTPILSSRAQEFINFGQDTMYAHAMMKTRKHFLQEFLECEVQKHNAHRMYRDQTPQNCYVTKILLIAQSRLKIFSAPKYKRAGGTYRPTSLNIEFQLSNQLNFS